MVFASIWILNTDMEDFYMKNRWTIQILLMALLIILIILQMMNLVSYQDTKFILYLLIFVNVFNFVYGMMSSK